MQRALACLPKLLNNRLLHLIKTHHVAYIILSVATLILFRKNRQNHCVWVRLFIIHYLIRVLVTGWKGGLKADPEALHGCWIDHCLRNLIKQSNTNLFLISQAHNRGPGFCNNYLSIKMTRFGMRAILEIILRCFVKHGCSWQIFSLRFIGVFFMASTTGALFYVSALYRGGTRWYWQSVHTVLQSR